MLRFSQLPADYHQVGSVGRMLKIREGVSVVGSGTPHWPCRTWSALMAVWSEAFPMTASCHSCNLSGIKRRIDFPISHTCLYVHPSSNLAETLTKNENPKLSSQRVLERQRRQGLPIARSHSWSMRYLHYPNPENTRSIKKLRTNMENLLNDQSSWRITSTSANDMCFSRFNIS